MKKNGQTLIEMIVVVGVVILIVTGIVVGTTISLSRTTLVRSRTTAAELAQEGVELARAKRDAGWQSFVALGIPETTYCVGEDEAFLVQADNCATVNIAPDFIRKVTLSYDGVSVPPRMSVVSSVHWGDTQQTGNTIRVSTALTNWR